MIQILIGVCSFLLFLLYQVTGIYAGDSGDLVTAACTFGVPHPPGYPFYTLVGRLLCLIPVSTPSYRVTFLSNIPHALTLVYTYLSIKKLTGSSLFAFFGFLVLLGNYLFFLYSVTPEVFALFDLFVMVLVYMSLRFLEKPTKGLFYCLVFVFSLSLSHHHVILFLMPSLLYVLFVHKAVIRQWISRLGNTAVLFFVFILGILPYLYIPIAARHGSMVNWDRAVDFSSFIHLVLRKDYGTFIANGVYGKLLVQRLLQIKAYVEFMLHDFSWFGILLGAGGILWVVSVRKKSGIFLLLSIFFMGPAFLFYASFPLMNRFTLGTYERFLLPSYALFSLFISVGAFSLYAFLTKRYGNLRILVLLVLFLYPLLYLIKTSKTFAGFSVDRTADNLGIDILSSVPSGSVLVIGRDTPLFISQYVRYALGTRKDIVLIHLARLGSKEYFYDIKKNFPDLKIPESTEKQSLDEFFISLSEKGLLFSNIRIAVPDTFYWVPHGLVYALVPKDVLPSFSELENVNEKLFSSYHSPLVGVLSGYNHLMLSDVKSIYAGSFIQYGQVLLKFGKTEKASEVFERAIGLSSDIDAQDAYTYLGLTRLFQKRCTDALDAFKKAREAGISADSVLLLYESITEGDCRGDKDRAREFMRLYENEKKKGEVLLESL